jgi:serine protease Do
MKNQQLKPYLVGLLVSVFVIASFFIGAVADRLFIIKPLNNFVERAPLISSSGKSELTVSQNTSSLGLMMQAGRTAVADIAEKASESAVTVSIKTQQRVIDPNSIFSQFGFFGFDQSEARIEEIQKDIGSGFVVEGNLIVTNKHVVADVTAQYLIIDQDDQEYEVTEIYRDPTLDLAILQVKDFSAPALALGDSDQLRVGESVIAIGTALGQFRHTVTTGVVSGVGRSITASGATGQFEDLQNVIQTDAAINPGNSGGPLIDDQGYVIGVNVAMASAENVSFAIPINVVKAALNNFNQTGQFDRPMMGISYSVISERAALLNEVPQGAYLVEVAVGGSADEAGLVSGDIITEFAGEKIDEQNKLAELINQQKIGTKVALKVWHDGKEKQLTVVLKSNQN